MLSASVILRDLGTRAERGLLRWRVVDQRGHTARAGSRVAAVYPGGRLRIALGIPLGTRASTRTGTYRLIVSYQVGAWRMAGASDRFWQPY